MVLGLSDLEVTKGRARVVLNTSQEGNSRHPILLSPLPYLPLSVTAQANAELVMETLKDVEELDGFMRKDKYADPDFTRKLWAYLTVNQMMAER